VITVDRATEPQGNGPGPMRLILLGAPGAGKGTYSEALSHRYHIPKISTGDILRHAVQAGNALGRQAKQYMDDGQLVPDDTMIGIVGERLVAEDCADGWVLDGFPRTVGQADALEQVLGRLGQSIDLVLVVEVSLTTLITRLTKRRMCPGCGANFNLLTMPPAKPEVCDHCGAALVQRSDDSEDVIQRRFTVYERETKPLIEYYHTHAAEKVRRIQSEGTIEAVMHNIIRILEQKRAGVPPR